MSTRTSSTSKNDKDDNDMKRTELKCGFCLKVCKSNEKFLPCSACDRHFHIHCQKVSDSMYDVLSADLSSETPCMLWFCNTSCNLYGKKVITSMVQMRKEIDTLKDQVGKVVGNVRSLDTRVSEMEGGLLSDELENAVKRVAIEEIENDRRERSQERVNVQVPDDMFEDAVSTAVREMSERQARKKSIIIHNIPMSNSGDMKVRIAHDKKCFGKLCSKGLELKQHITPKRITRLGKKEDKKRPMKVTFDSPAVVGDIFRSASKLKGKDFFKDISITSDKTPLERAEWKKLLELKEQRQAESDAQEDGTKWIILGHRVLPDRNQSQALEDASPEEGQDTWG